MTAELSTSRSRASRLSVVVPTLGLSRWLVACLKALRRDGGEEIEIVLVSQGEIRDPKAEKLADRVLRQAANSGFAAANNAALAAAHGDYLATVNDDAIVAQGWCASLLAALESHPEAAAAQGINLALRDRHASDPPRVDGGGLAWNRHWQAVQIGRGRPPCDLPAGTCEVFGVSATAAIYRRQALERVAGTEGEIFDPRLFAYYEDVDLACRLRGAGYRALRVPAAAAEHAGSVSGKQLPGGNRRLIYGNRHLVLARLLGRAFWLRWPRILLRDVADLWQATRRGDTRAMAGIVAGGGRALRHRGAFARLGPPLVPLQELRQFRIDTGGSRDEYPW